MRVVGCTALVSKRHGGNPSAPRHACRSPPAAPAALPSLPSFHCRPGASHTSCHRSSYPPPSNHCTCRVAIPLGPVRPPWEGAPSAHTHARPLPLNPHPNPHHTPMAFPTGLTSGYRNIPHPPCYPFAQRPVYIPTPSPPPTPQVAELARTRNVTSHLYTPGQGWGQ